MLKFVSNVRQLFSADDFSRGNFPDAFFLGTLRVNSGLYKTNMVDEQKKKFRVFY